MNRAAPHPICVKLRELRKAAGLSLTEMEDRFQVNPVLVGSYERGDRTPPLPKIDYLLALFGYRIAAVPIEGAHTVRVGGDLVADLRAIADELELTQANQSRERERDLNSKGMGELFNHFADAQ